jgi:hypothetical protein
MKAIVVVAATCALSACASITSGTTQTIAISTTPKAGAVCEVANEKGHWTVNPTPGITTVTKSYGDLTISCSHPDGDRGAISLQSSTAGSAFGNILVGGVIGAAVDMASGAAYTYPSNVAVPLAASAPVASNAAPVAAIHTSVMTKPGS